MKDEFNALFKGLDRVYGTYKITKQEGKKRVGNKRKDIKTVHEPVTDELWGEHLDGKIGIGITPINDNNACSFAAIDIDDYNINIDEFEKLVRDKGLPLIACRTKSGGVHLYIFFSEPIQAVSVRQILAQWASVLGYPDVEVFPKQDTLAGKEDAGNWINMPYFNAKKTDRYAVLKGKKLSARQFLNLAKKISIDEQALAKISIGKYLQDAPPCLQALVTGGVGEGMRNNVVMNFCVLAQLMEPEGDWESIVIELNDLYITPPLESEEVAVILKSNVKGKYFYTCGVSPFPTVCNKKICKTKEYGVGSKQKLSIEIESLTKLCSVPPVWIMQVSGKRLRMSTDELTIQHKFAKRCMEAVNYFPPTVKNGVWLKLINKMLGEVVEIEAPQDSGPEGQFIYHLEQFCITKAPAMAKAEMLLGKPWHDPDGRTYFRSADLLQYLDQQHFREFKAQQIYALLKQMENVDHHFFNEKGVGINCWSIPQRKAQIEDFDLPDTTDKEEF